MPWYRRNHRAWGSYFLTLVTHGRCPLFRDSAARWMLREAMRATLAGHPMTFHEMVLLPEHLHILCGIPDEGQLVGCITCYARLVAVSR